MVRTKQKAAKTLKSLLSKKKEPSLDQLEETYFEQEELLFSSEDEVQDEEEEKEKEQEESNLSTNKKTKKSSSPRGVIYLGRLPHGFYEKEMKKYFSQFGTVTKVKLYRNPKTGKSQHYAHIEFLHAKIAPIVAKTMDGYLLFGHQLKCQVIPSNQTRGIFPPLQQKEKRKETLTALNPTHHQAYQQVNSRDLPTYLQHLKKHTYQQVLEASKKWKALGIEYDVTSLIEKEINIVGGSFINHKKKETNEKRKETKKRKKGITKKNKVIKT